MKIKNFLSLLPALLLFASALVFAQGAPGPSNYPISMQVGVGAPSGTCPGTNVIYMNSSNGNIYTCPTPGGSWVLASGGSGGSSNFNLTNSTPATSSTPQSSPYAGWNGTWWGPTLASATDGWTLQDIPGTSTTMAAGLVSHCAETSGVVTLTGTGMTVFPTNQAGPLGVGAIVTFAGFTTCTWLNGVPVSLITNTATSITFDDPSNHANQASVAESGVTASSAQSTLTLKQVAGSAPLGVLQFLNSATATATSVNTTPALEFTANSWTGTISQQMQWDIFSKGNIGNNNPSLFFSLTGNNPANAGGSIFFASVNSSAQGAPQLAFANINNGFANIAGQIGVQPSDGVTNSQGYNFFAQAAATSTGLLGNAGTGGAADVDIGGQVTRTNTTGPNYGIVLGGINLSGTIGGYGKELFQPASGSSKNIGVWVGTEFDPTAGSTSFIGVNINPTITGTTSGPTTALSVDPQLTATNLTGTNCQQTWHDGTATGTTPGTLLVCMDYSGVLIPSVIYSAAGTAIPACNSARKGGRTVVSDATTPTFLGTYASGGAVVAPVMCNGTNWVTY
jgi:hypothetical protein